MGFAISYCSTRSIDAEQVREIWSVVDRLSAGKTWLSCEPIYFHRHEDGGILGGSSKPNFMPDPEDAASAAQEGLPDGNILDALDVLCRLSREFNVDWELSHDFSEGPIGYIRGGNCEPQLIEQIEGIAGLAEMFDELSEEGGSEPGFTLHSSDNDKDEEDDDDGPTILPFRPK